MHSDHQPCSGIEQLRQHSQHRTQQQHRQLPVSRDMDARASDGPASKDCSKHIDLLPAAEHPNGDAGVQEQQQLDRALRK